MRALMPSSIDVHACDINEEMISFNQKNYGDISYSLISYLPPTSYPGEYFDFVYGLSIFTHIETGIQENWMKEIHRILNKGGIFLFTTQGKFFYSKLLQTEKTILEARGEYSKNYSKKGHRMMSTYNSPEMFRKTLGKYFQILEFHDGETDPGKIGGQDLWIVKRP